MAGKNARCDNALKDKGGHGQGAGPASVAAYPRIERADKAVAPIFREDVLKRTPLLDDRLVEIGQNLMSDRPIDEDAKRDGRGCEQRKIEAASRKLAVRRRLIRDTQNISCSAHRLDHRRAPAIDLCSYAADMRFNGIRARIEVKAPNLFEKHPARDKPTVAAQQDFEQAEFPRLQFDGLARALDGSTSRSPAASRVGEPPRVGRRASA